jgi:hypothetical protein
MRREYHQFWFHLPSLSFYLKEKRDYSVQMEMGAFFTERLSVWLSHQNRNRKHEEEKHSLKSRTQESFDACLSLPVLEFCQKDATNSRKVKNFFLSRSLLVTKIEVCVKTRPPASTWNTDHPKVLNKYLSIQQQEGYLDMSSLDLKLCVTFASIFLYIYLLPSLSILTLNGVLCFSHIKCQMQTLAKVTDLMHEKRDDSCLSKALFR